MTLPTLRPWLVVFPDGNDLVILPLTRQKALLTAHALCDSHTTVRPATDW